MTASDARGRLRSSPTTRKFEASVRTVGSGTSCRDPASITGEPAVACAEARPNGKRRRSVVACSGSSAAIRSRNARSPRSRPRRWRSAARNAAFCASAPPPLPKIEPMKAVAAIESLTVQRAARAVERGPVRVDAGRVGAQVAQDLAALGAVDAAEQALLTGHDRLGLLARREAAPARDEPEGVEAGDLGHRGTRRPAGDGEQELAIACAHPADAVPDVGARAPGDVRHPVAVAQDGQAPPRRLLARRRAGGRQRLGLEELAQVGARHVAELRREGVVGPELVARVLRERDAAPLAGRQDVVRAVGRRAGRRDERGEHHGQRRHGGRRRPPAPPGAHTHGARLPVRPKAHAGAGAGGRRTMIQVSQRPSAKSGRPMAVLATPSATTAPAR